MNTLETPTVSVPAAETIINPTKAAKVAKPTPAAKEGQGGKGNVIGSRSKAQLRADFVADSGALAAVLVSLGALERIQSNKHGVLCRRVYADLATLETNRNKLAERDRKLASAALDALRAVGALRGKFVSLELFANSVAVRSRKEAGKFHKPQAK